MPKALCNYQHLYSVQTQHAYDNAQVCILQPYELKKRSIDVEQDNWFLDQILNQLSGLKHRPYKKSDERL